MAVKKNQYKSASILLGNTDIYPFWKEDIVVPRKINQFATCLLFFRALYDHPTFPNTEDIYDIHKRIYGYRISTSHFNYFFKMCVKNNRREIRLVCLGYSFTDSENHQIPFYNDSDFEDRINMALDVLRPFCTKEKKSIIKKIGRLFSH